MFYIMITQDFIFDFYSRWSYTICYSIVEEIVVRYKFPSATVFEITPGGHVIVNKAEVRVSKRVFQEIKARQISQKMNIS